MIGAAGATGRGPAIALACMVVTRGARDVTGITRTAADFTVALCTTLVRRCLCLTGTVPANPLTAESWSAKVKAMIRDAVARNDLSIERYHSPYR